MNSANQKSRRLLEFGAMKEIITLICLSVFALSAAGQELKATSLTYSGTFSELGEGKLVIYTINDANVEGYAIVAGLNYSLNGTYQNDKAQIDLVIGDDTKYMLDLKSWQHGVMKGKLIKGNWDGKIGKVELFEETSNNKFAGKNWNYTGDKYHSLDVSFSQMNDALYMTMTMMQTETTSYNYYHGKLQKVDDDTYRLKSADACDLIIFYNSSHDLEIHPADKDNTNCSAVKGNIFFEAEID